MNLSGKDIGESFDAALIQANQLNGAMKQPGEYSYEKPQKRYAGFIRVVPSFADTHLTDGGISHPLYGVHIPDQSQMR